MELNIVKQIRSLRAMLRRKPKDKVEVKEIKQKLSSLRPVITRKPMGKPPVKVNIDGKEMTLKELASEYGLQLKTVQARYKVGNRGKLLCRPSQSTYNRTPKDDLTNSL